MATSNGIHLTSPNWNLSMSGWMGASGIAVLQQVPAHFNCCIHGDFRKKFVCHHSSFSKVPSMKNKKGISKNSERFASTKVKIKLDTTRTRMTDKFIERGLVGVITITSFHKHSLMTAETLRFLPAEECREQFENYFNDGMEPAESAKYHKGVLEMNADFQPSDLANSRINPTQRTIEYWHEK
ncbi:hypothetical protein AVEN_230888-1 [Araneus ventricosus]|uniref:Uncharacterized protein n=1 Tax=Araneus ventricosus TaxID=182803 RepID=A0A4Y2A4T3_ARAVE|nr:hypothetical protein AVEN_230888-1 [Araneus ventricosus]